eukprot:gene33752-40840_t
MNLKTGLALGWLLCFSFSYRSGLFAWRRQKFSTLIRSTIADKRTDYTSSNAFGKPQLSHLPNQLSKTPVLAKLLQSKGHLSSPDFNRYLTKRVAFLNTNELTTIASEISDILEGNVTQPIFFDIKTITAVSYACIQQKLYKDVLRLHQSVNVYLSKGQHHCLLPDAHYFSLILRAAVYVKSWDGCMELLHKASSLLPANSMEPVIHSTMTSLIYTSYYRELTQQKAFDLFEFAIQQGVVPSARLCDAMLIVLCKHGSTADVSKGLALMQQYQIPLTIHTFNALLHRLAVGGKVSQCVALRKTMRSLNITASAYTFEMMLKACAVAGDITEAETVCEEMASAGVALTSAAAVQLMRMNKDASALMNSNQNTSYFYRYAIQLSSNVDAAFCVFQQAVAAGLADSQVHLSLVQYCAAHDRLDDAHKLLRFMLENQLCDNFVLSYMVELCTRRGDVDGLQRLVQYLLVVQQKQPHLLSFQLEQQLAKALLQLQQPALALDILAAVFGGRTQLSQSLLATVFGELRDRFLVSRPNDLPVANGSPPHGANSSSLLELRFEYVEGKLVGAVRTVASIAEQLRYASDAVSRYICQVLVARGPALNKWLAHNELETAFSLCVATGNASVVVSFLDMLQGEDSSFAPPVALVAEIVRYARRHDDSETIKNAIFWAVKQRVRVPFKVMSDALAGLYGLGKTEDVLQVYQCLHDNQLVQHWAVKKTDELVIDLHGFGRGMAFAAVSLALKEVKEDINLKAKTLTIITGQNLRDQSGEKAYTLMNELQEVLVEGTFPPIPTSTIPGNVGRLLVDLTYVRNAVDL